MTIISLNDELLVDSKEDQMSRTAQQRLRCRRLCFVFSHWQNCVIFFAIQFGNLFVTQRRTLGRGDLSS
jgi:hypothetical protein